MYWQVQGRIIPPCDKCKKPMALIVQGRIAIDSYLEEVESNQVIFVDCVASGLPEWACPNCRPQWSDVNRIARQLFDWQKAKEVELVAQDFVKAAEYRDRQASMRRLLFELVGEIINGP